MLQRTDLIGDDHIDLYQIYKKPMVKTAIYHNKYRDLGLNSVSRALLNEGKSKDLDGLQIQKLPKEKQLEYVTQDVALVMKLCMYNDFQILDLMNAFSAISSFHLIEYVTPEFQHGGIKLSLTE